MASRLLDVLISSVAVLIAAFLLGGVVIDNLLVVFVVAIVLGILNSFLRPIFILLTLPLTIFTLGLFIFVINALLVMLAAWIVPGFSVANFGWALLFSLIVSIISLFLGKNRNRKVGEL